ncbi:hypothetical protein P4S55_24345 [Shewanella sp. PP-Sp27a-2]
MLKSTDGLSIIFSMGQALLKPSGLFIKATMAGVSGGSVIFISTPQGAGRILI